MESTRFKVVLTGHLIDGFDPDQVAEALGKIFNAPARRFIRLFAGEPFPIKKTMREADAQRLMVKLKVAGADCQIQEVAISKSTDSRGTSATWKDRLNGLLLNPRYRLIAVLGLLLVVVMAGSGMYLSGGAEKARNPGVLEAESNAPMTPREKAGQGLENFARSARVWMLEFGGTFDSHKVTVERLKEDLELPDDALADPWGSRFIFEPEGRSFTVRSAGPDLKPNSPDDLILKSGF